MKMKTKWYFSLVCVFFTLIFLMIGNQNAFSQLPTGYGAISGRVTDASNNDALTNGIANVNVGYCDSNGYCFSWTQTDGSGNYTLSASEGSWKVMFNPQQGNSYYLQEWYNDKSNPSSADPVSVTTGQTKSGINAQLVTGGAISGRVTDASNNDALTNGIANVNVGYCDSNGYCFNWTQTDGYGNYTLNAPAGNWNVMFNPWAAVGNYLSEWYDNKSNLGTADSVSVTAGVTTGNINAQLEVGATISGTVTNANGTPLANVNVSANNPGGGSGGCTNSSGIYTISGLSPGTYRVSAGGYNWCGDGSDYVQIYYNNTPDWNSATLVTLDPGQTRFDINFTGMVLGATVSGQVTNGVNPLANIPVSVHGPGWGYGACTDSNGIYTIHGIYPDTTYRVSAGGYSCNNGPTYAQVYYVAANNTTPNYSLAKQFTLSSGETLPDINFTGMVLAATATGTVKDANGVLLANVQVNVSKTGLGYGGCTNSDGVYTIGGITPGTDYRVSAGGNANCPGGMYYSQAFYDNKTDWNSADLVSMNPGQLTTINFSGLVKLAAISGNLQGDPGIGVKGLNVVLHDSQGRLVNYNTTWQNGGYFFSNLTAGSYTIKVYDPFLNYLYKEQGVQVSLGTLTNSNITLTTLTPGGTNPPSFKSDPLVFVYRNPDNQEYLNLVAEVVDPSGCQPPSIKSVTVVDPAGQLHYLYHQKYQALIDDPSGPSYAEFWQNSRDNALSNFTTLAGNYTFTILDIEGNRVSRTVSLGSYTPPPLYKLSIPTLASPTNGWQANPNEDLTLSWNSVSGAAFYQVRIFENGEMILKENVDSTSFIVPQGCLSPSRWYSWNVAAFDNAVINNADYRSNSSSRSFRFTDGSTPETPSLTVNIVPWVSGFPLIPHDAYAGHETTLKAVVKGGTPPYLYTWDFGDGTSQSIPSPAIAGRDLEGRHQYGISDTNLFNAKVTVTDKTGISVSAYYPVRFWADPSRGVKVNVAIDDALWSIHKNLSLYSSGGNDYAYLPGGNTAGTIAMALQAWVLNGHKPDGDPNNPYTDDALRAKNYILSRLFPVCIAPETIAGITRNPDSNGNGQGLYVKNDHRLYETGLVLMALSTLKDPDLLVTVQDLVDYLAYAQVEPDAGGGRGGWRYDTNYRESDMSVTQFPLLGLEAAEHHMGSMGVTIPSYVKEELKNNFLYFVQNKEPVQNNEQWGGNSGGFGYSGPNHWMNVAKTGAGIVGLALTGLPYSDPRVTSAMQFIDRHWYQAEEDSRGSTEAYNIGDLYAMYAVMKGMKSYEMRGANTTKIGGHDWYDEYAQWAIQNQKQNQLDPRANGSWPSVNTYGSYVDTLFGVLLLLPQVFDIGPTAVAQASPTSVQTYLPVTFSHSGSFHRDSSKSIVTYAWDFNGDGTVVWTTGGSNTTRTYTYTTPGTYTAKLTVTDSAGLTDTDQVTITVTEAPFVLATIKIEPETLNLGAKGVFTAFITLPANTNYILANIDTSSLVCEGAPVVNTNMAANKLIAKFNVQDLKGVPVGDKVTLTVTGRFKDGRPFKGFDTIRVISKKK
jgi:putative hemolysin